jgi:hypothetical protein
MCMAQVVHANRLENFEQFELKICREGKTFEVVQSAMFTSAAAAAAAAGAALRL